MTIDTEELQEIMPDMVKERAEETLKLTRVLRRRKSAAMRIANHTHWRHALGRIHGGNSQRLKDVAGAFNTSMSGVKRRLSISPFSSPKRGGGVADDKTSQWVPRDNAGKVAEAKAGEREPPAK